ncbi:MAG: hypothetical protein V4543_03020 [Bacteroidota bacterium]
MSAIQRALPGILRIFLILPPACFLLVGCGKKVEGVYHFDIPRMLQLRGLGAASDSAMATGDSANLNYVVRSLSQPLLSLEPDGKYNVLAWENKTTGAPSDTLVMGVLTFMVADTLFSGFNLFESDTLQNGRKNYTISGDTLRFAMYPDNKFRICGDTLRSKTIVLVRQHAD